MSKLNYKIREYTQNSVGTKVPKISAIQQLTRLTLASMLFEDQFYMDGKSHYEQVLDLCKIAPSDKIADLAVKARTEFKLRHIPLVLLRELARYGKLQKTTLTSVINRPDEMGEFLAHYWKDGKQPLSNQVKRGLAECFNKFNEYQLAKWDTNRASVKLKDVLFLTHPKPHSPEQEALFKRIANNELATPDTWETQLSSGKEKGETFTRLINENKLGALAFIRNLRNMLQANVSETLIKQYAKTVNTTMVLPFRYIAASLQVPQLEDMLEEMMLKNLEQQLKFTGKTIVLVDVSGSMFGTKVSKKSDLVRFDAAAALAMICKELCEQVEIYSFSDNLIRVKPRRGFALREAILHSQHHMGTQLGRACNMLNAQTDYDRIIVITDEQSYDRPPAPKNRGYMINVASYQNGINHSSWTEINGFSENVFKYIQEYEKLD